MAAVTTAMTSAESVTESSSTSAPSAASVTPWTRVAGRPSARDGVRANTCTS